MAFVLASIMTVSIITFIGHTRAVKRILDQNSCGGEVEMMAPKDVLVWHPRFEDPGLTPKAFVICAACAAWDTLFWPLSGNWRGSFHSMEMPCKVTLAEDLCLLSPFSYPETNTNPMPMIHCSFSHLKGSNQVNVFESRLHLLKSYCDPWTMGCQRWQAK